MIKVTDARGDHRLSLELQIVVYNQNLNEFFSIGPILVQSRIDQTMWVKIESSPEIVCLTRGVRSIRVRSI